MKAKHEAQEYGLMLDTNVFNDVVDGKLLLEEFKDRKLFATHVQMDELQQTSCDARKRELLAVFNYIDAATINTESAVSDVSKWDQSKWSDPTGNFIPMLNRLRELAKAGASRIPNQSRDILIAETAIKNGLILVSGDRDLRVVTKEFGGQAVDLKKIETHRKV